MSVTLNASTSSGFIQSADTSGTVEIQSNGTTKFTVATTGAYGQLVSDTAKASTSGTSVDFTGIPSWVKRINVIFQSVSTNGTSIPIIQLGTSSGIVSTGYVGVSSQCIDGAVGNAAALSVGFDIRSSNAASIRSGLMTICLVTGSTWVASGVFGQTGVTATTTQTGGYIVLSGTLDRVRITTVNGTDTFDAGTINILYEG